VSAVRAQQKIMPNKKFIVPYTTKGDANMTFKSSVIVL